MGKIRLDVLLTERKLAESRNRAQALIMAGRVRVDGRIITKVGTPVSTEVSIEIENDLPYVSRGGIKLSAALDAFAVDPAGAICADVGASTGGFTDVLLQRNAARVYAIDVGYGQLAWKLRQDERVIVMERTNARHLTALPEPISLATIDASFISLKLILPAVMRWLDSPAFMIALVKPQFEAGKNQVGKGGVVRELAVHRQVLQETATYINGIGLTVIGMAPSPITGPAGNYEFFICAGKETDRKPIDIEASIEACLSTLSSSKRTAL
jgi:23S rRNA (cytidine1920-2'-O)/16S rRNA (cytidine1409-2'-O)-methyltransferase